MDGGNEIYAAGYYQGMLQAAELKEDTGQCFNCNETGHKERECLIFNPACKWDVRPMLGTMGPAPAAAKT